MGDDDAVRLMEFILLITGHPIPEDLASIRPATEEEIRDDQTVRHGYKYEYCVILHAHCGQPVLVSGFSPEQYQAIYDGIDHHLTAEDMSKISYPLSTLLANLERCPHRPEEKGPGQFAGTTAARWALLCMHVGAPISPSLKFCLYAAYEKNGFTANAPERSAYNEILMKEVSLYAPGLPLRIVRETPMAVIATGFSRFNLQPFSRSQVLHSCAACGILAADATFKMKKCSGCCMRFYCSPECQKAHWKAAHKRECRELKSVRAQTMPELLATLQEAPEFAEFVRFMGARGVNIFSDTVLFPPDAPGTTTAAKKDGKKKRGSRK